MLSFAACSKKIYPEAKHDSNLNPSERNENLPLKTDSKELKAFLEAGTGKHLNIGNTTVEDIIKTAHKFMGVPHCMGGSTAKCIDCSGLVMAVFAKNNISLPHSSEEQARYGQIIRKKSDLKRGDLVYFIKSYKTSKYITHTGIYIGNSEMIHTSSSKGVIISSLDNVYWKDKFIFGTRLLTEK